MKIGSQYTFNALHARHWEQFAHSAGLAKAPARKRILSLASALPQTARTLQANPQARFAGNAIVEQINALIEQRCALTIRRLTAPVEDAGDEENEE